MKKHIYIFSIVLIGVVILLTVLSNPPKDGVYPVTVIVDEGDTLGNVSVKLENANVVKSADVFELFVMLFDKEKNIQQGDFYFDKPMSNIAVMRQLTGEGSYNNKIKITLPEGIRNKEIADELEMRFADFDRALFLEGAREGYLFPDTYYFWPSVDEIKIRQALESNFSNKISTLAQEISNSNFTQDEVIILASIIENESSGKGDREIISGILQNRLSKGMLLQVDATLDYVLDKSSSELTMSDLKMDSPYNTYRYLGLPPTPISNPGIESIRAVLHPTETEYLFYLHDSEGNAYYAETFEDHIKNKFYYLD